MLEFIKAIVIYFGGGIGIAAAFIILFKGFIKKWVETIIDTSAQKSISRLTDSLNRHAKAYDKLLEKEFIYYDECSKYTSKLIVDIQDVYQGTKDKNFIRAKECMLRTLKEIPVFKNITLLYQCFVPIPIFTAASQLLANLQKELEAVVAIMKSSLSNENDEQQIKSLEVIQDLTLHDCSFLMMSIKIRLDSLAE